MPVLSAQNEMPGFMARNGVGIFIAVILSAIAGTLVFFSGFGAWAASLSQVGLALAGSVFGASVTLLAGCMAIRVRRMVRDGSNPEFSSSAGHAGSRDGKKGVGIDPDHTFDGLLVLDDWKIVEANEVACRIFGVSENRDLIGSSIVEKVSEESADLFAVRRFEMETSGDLPGTNLFRFRTEAGSVVDLEVRMVFLDDDDSLKVRMIFQDVTMVGSLAARLMDVENRFENLVGNSIQGVFVSRDEQFLFANQMAADIFGYDSPEQLAEYKPLDLYAEAVRGQLKSYHKARMKGKPAPREYETRGLRKDGEEILLRQTVVPIDWEGERAVLVFLVDITEQKQTSKRLAEGESILRAVLDNSPAGIMIQDASGGFLAGNRVFFQESGLVQEEAIGKRMGEIFHGIEGLDETNRNIIRTAWQEARKTEKPVPVEFGLEREDGYRRRSGFCFPVMDDQGELIALANISLDVTEQHLAEEALRRSEMQLNAVIQNVPAAFRLCDREGRYLVVNPEYGAILGKGKDEIIGRTVEEICSKEVVERIRGYEEQILKTGRPLSYEREFTESDGVIRTRLVSLFPVAAPDGGAMYIGAFSTDISDRKQIEMEVLESRRMLQVILDSIPTRVFWKDRESRFMGCNQRLADDLGFAMPEQILGKKDDDLFSGSSAERFRSDDLEIMGSGETRLNFEETQIMKTGEKRWLRTTKMPLVTVAGETVGIIGCYEDITDVRRAHEELEESRAQMMALIDNSPNEITLTDLDGRFLMMNKTLLNGLGATLDDVKGRRVSEIDAIPQEAAERIERQTREVRDADEQRRYEVVTSIFGKGQRELVIWRFPVKAGDGKTIGFGSVAIDVSQIRRTESALRKTEERFRGILAHATASISLKGLDGRYEVVNPAFLDRSGFAREEVVGKTARDIYGLEDALEIERMDREIMESGEPRIFEEERGYRGGQSYFFLAAKFPIYGADGKITGLGAVSFDISEQKKVERQIRQSQKIMRTVLDTIPVRVFWKDRNLTYLGCSRKFLEDAGLKSFTDVVGKKDTDFLKLKDAKKFRADDLEVINSGIGRFGFEQPITAHKGNTRWLRTTKVPLRDDDGEIMGIVGCYEDITDFIRTNSERRRQQAVFQSVMDNLPAEIVVKDKDGRFEIANRYFGKVRGIDIETIAGKRNEDVYEEKLAEDTTRRDREVMRRKEPHLYERTIVDRDGSDMVLLVNKYPIVDETGGIIGVGSVSNDITGIKKAENALIDMEARFKAFLENAPANIIMRDVEGRLVHANTSFLARIGVSLEEVKGRTPEEMFDAERARIIRSQHEEVLATGRHQTYDISLNDPDNIRRDIVAHRFPIRNTYGEIIGTGAFRIDVSDIKVLERRLRSSEAFLAAVFDAIPESILVFDSEERLIRANKDCFDMFPEVVDVCHPGAHYDEILEALFLGDAIEEGRREVFRKEVAESRGIRKKSGSVARVRQFSNDRRMLVQETWTANGELVLSALDLGRLRIAGIDLSRLGEEGRAVHAEDIIAMTAHDLNNVFAAILSEVDFMRSDCAAASDREDSRRNIGLAVGLGADATRRLEMISKNVEPRPEASGVAEVLSTVRHVVRRITGDVVDLNISGVDGLPPVLLDPVLLENALLGVGRVMREALPLGGTIDVSLSLEKEGAGREGEPRAVRMIVKENSGRCDFPEMLFEGFADGKSGTVEMVRENGICSKAVFRFAAVTALCEPMSDGLPGGTETILLVEDDDVVRQGMIRTFEELGYCVLAARSEEDALGLLESEDRPQLLVSDLHILGRMGGLDIARMVRRRYRDIKVLFVSGMTFKEMGAEKEVIERTGLLRKPFSKKEVAVAVRRVLDGVTN